MFYAQHGAWLFVCLFSRYFFPLADELGGADLAVLRLVLSFAVAVIVVIAMPLSLLRLRVPLTVRDGLSRAPLEGVGPAPPE